MIEDYNEYMNKHVKDIYDSLNEAYKNDSLQEYLLEDGNIIKYVVDSSIKYVAVFVQVEGGGPATYIDTYEQRIECCSGSERYYYYLPYEMVKAIDNIMIEYFNMSR